MTPKRSQTLARHVQPKRRITTEEARSGLYKLVRGLSEVDAPASTLLDRAIGIELRGREHSAWLVAEVDGQATLAYIEELEERLETLASILALRSRKAEHTGETIPAEQLAHEFGFDELLR
ncbi:MAG: hypothetical protein H0U03_13145 [Actinobacteria bacterium]|nr:hypothetical protein [Actinomycetota bacterium]